MRKTLFGLAGLALLFLAHPVLAQKAPSEPDAALAAIFAPDPAAPAPATLPADGSLLQPISDMMPKPQAVCEVNFCSHERVLCQQECAPCTGVLVLCSFKLCDSSCSCQC
jgi:hypothetical protein